MPRATGSPPNACWGRTMNSVGQGYIEAVFDRLIQGGPAIAAALARELCIHKTSAAKALLKLEQTGSAYRKRKQRNGAVVWAATGAPLVMPRALASVEPLPWATTIPMVEHPVLRWGIGG